MADRRTAFQINVARILSESLKAHYNDNFRQVFAKFTQPGGGQASNSSRPRRPRRPEWSDFSFERTAEFHFWYDGGGGAAALAVKLLLLLQFAKWVSSIRTKADLYEPT